MNRSSEMHARTAPDGASTEEVVSALDANRAALDQTLSEIEHRLSPEGLMDAAMDYLRGGSGTEYLRGLRDSVVHNPVPVTLTAIGLAWTMFAERSGGHGGTDSSTSSGNASARLHSGAESARAGVSAVGEKAGEGMEAARRGLSGARDRLARGREGLSQARERMSGMSDAAAARYRHSADATREFARDHPMVLAGAGLALGAALAALLPPTRAEDEYLGEARDRTLDRAKETASEQAEHLRERAQSVRDAARQEAERQGLTGERAGEMLADAERRVQRVAEAARQEAGSGDSGDTRPGQHH